MPRRKRRKTGKDQLSKEKSQTQRKRGNALPVLHISTLAPTDTKRRLFRGTGKVNVPTDCEIPDALRTAIDNKEFLVTLRSRDTQKCVVFTHFMPGGLSVFDRNQHEQICERWSKQLEPYRNCPSVERVFVFISTGYEALLSIRDLTPPFSLLESDREHVRILKRAARDAKCVEKVVPIGLDDLLGVLSALERRATGRERNIRFLLLGSGKNMRYDSPKMVDAILRIAGRFTDRPVFRIDQDVKVNEKALRLLLKAYFEIPVRKGIFAYSGGYGVDTQGGATAQAPQDMLLNNFAIRTSHLARQSRNGWRVNSGEAKQFLKTMGHLGAPQGFSKKGDDAKAQVISGAWLCLSHEAISRLPPFTNLDNHIVWIDDYLKRRMHEGLNDLGDNITTARIAGACLEQNRHPDGLRKKDMRFRYWNKKLGKYERYTGIEDYLCRLARGCLWDALIYERGSQDDKAGPYTRGIRDFFSGRADTLPSVFREGRADDGSRPESRELTEFGCELAKTANRRITKLAKAWKAELSDQVLEGSDGETVRQKFPKECLASATLERNTVENAKDNRVYEVLEDAEQYLQLLDVWRDFVDLLEGMTSGHDWFFDRPPSQRRLLR